MRRWVPFWTLLWLVIWLCNGTPFIPHNHVWIGWLVFALIVDFVF